MRYPLLICAGVFLGSVAVFAQQDAPLPEPEIPGTTPVEQPFPSPLASPPRQLIPPDVLPPSKPAATSPNVTTIPQLDAELARGPVNAAAHATQLQIGWRELRNRVANNADLKEKLRLAEAARTDLKKRQLLGLYYEAYFGRMMALASTPELKNYLEAEKDERLKTLAQPRTRPSPASAAKAKD